MDINIDHVAKLAKLRLTAKEKKMMEPQLPAILEFVGKLEEVDTSGVDVKAYLTDAVNVFRDDEALPVDEATRKALLDAFPQSTAGALKVPGVFE
ncbi:Asp-tRNA(Asn)/Glu-tRNA(Gln) amidotransferase subunit GatC [Candidatus Uhrbacteria bacterium]|nr:Asp-tRNA(Asn)/Glu-tRNA(Gln) amidotransferase subunit GatC [Candidatus Uhrbacteria bacterium]